jgi:ribonucleoside-diphosphate reductase beta chain
MKQAAPAVRHMVTANLLRQTGLDSIQGRGPAQIFGPVASIPELESLTVAWSFFEGNIHSRSYSHIIRNIYSVPKDEFNKIHHIPEIAEMAANIGQYYEQLHTLNCRVQLGLPVSQDDHIDAIWLALHASYALEAIRFMVSFATSLGMAENKLFIGNGNIVKLIMHDEMLHKEWTAYIINQVLKDDERFSRAEERCRAVVTKIYADVIREEKDWAKYLFNKGVVVGLNERIMHDFVDWMAADALKQIGLKHACSLKSTPLPWFNRQTDNNKEQVALQELESTSYLIGVMDAALDIDNLPSL